MNNTRSLIDICSLESAITLSMKAMRSTSFLNISFIDGASLITSL